MHEDETGQCEKTDKPQQTAILTKKTLSEVCRPIYHWKALAPAVRTMYWSNTSDSVFLTEFASLLWITQGKHLKTRYTLYLKFDFIYSLLSLSNYLCCLTTTYKQVLLIVRSCTGSTGRRSQVRTVPLWDTPTLVGVVRGRESAWSGVSMGSQALSPLQC